MIEQIITEIGKFLATHSKLIIGAIINMALIYVFCKIADAFNSRLEKGLKEKHPDSPLVNLMPIVTKTAKFVIIFLFRLLQRFYHSVQHTVEFLDYRIVVNKEKK